MSPKLRWAAEVLTPMQADGLACVICRANYLLDRHRIRHMVGHSHTGTQVFACTGLCTRAVWEARFTWVCDGCVSFHGWRARPSLDRCPCGGLLAPLGHSTAGTWIFTCTCTGWPPATTTTTATTTAVDDGFTWVCEHCLTPYSWADGEALGTCPCGGYLRLIGPDGFEVTR